MAEFSRRSFLFGSGAAAATALVPGAVRTAAAQIFAHNKTDACASRLSGGWEFRRGTLEGIWQAWRTEEDGLWQKTALPHCFNAQDACDPDLPYYRGEGWYRNRLEVKNPFPQGRTVLHFQGAGQTTSVWVGSHQVGVHKGGYDEFFLDITDALEKMPADPTAGGVPVAIRCDNGPDLERVPSDLSDFCLYGGLYRHVNLVYLPAVSLDMVHVLPVLHSDGSAHLTVGVQLYNPEGVSKSCRVDIEILDPAGKTVGHATSELAAWSGLNDLASFDVAAPSLWSPETPHLYRARVTLGASGEPSVVEERFGIRHIEFVEQGPFKLNGQRVMLRGTHRHADHSGLAAAMPDELVRQEMQLIRDMGANFIRLAHYQQDRLVLDLCDELGLMVWEEAPWCRAGAGDEAFQRNAKDMLTNMIRQHYNHPSVILWGLGNEDDWPDEYPSVNEDAIRQFMTEMRDLAHSLDGSRLTSFRRCDFARDIPDVYSPSIWAGWYRGDFREYEKSLLEQRKHVKRLIHIEWGADSQAGRHAEDPEAVLRKVREGNGTDERGLDYLKTGGEVRASRDGDWSETYACDLFDWHLKTQEKLDWFTGSAQWIFKDFASPLRSDNGIPNVNQKGVVERDLTKKESYFVFQSYWSAKPMVHIYGHSWPVRWGKPGELRTVRIYSNCDTAELMLNGKSMGTRKRDSQNFPAAGLRWEIPFAAGKNRIQVVAHKGGATVADEVEFEYQTEPWDKPAKFQLAEVARRGEVVTVEAKVFDSRGILCLDGRNAVRFSIAGAGTLIDNLGTVQGSRVQELANGRAQISLVRKGACVVGISADGLPPAFCSIA